MCSVAWTLQIYIPIHEKKDSHWYLMVISIADKNIYHLYSFLTQVNADKREDTDRAIVTLLTYAIEIICSQLSIYSSICQLHICPTNDVPSLHIAKYFH